MPLKKSDIAKNISSNISIKNSTSKEILDRFIKIIKSKSDTSDVKITNFGTFIKKVTPKRIGRNPKTGEEYPIAKRKKLSLIVSKKVRDRLN